jgi:uncharacterized oxidoreductase
MFIKFFKIFANHLAKQENAAIINVSGGVAFTPMAATPIYGATKAGIHSFTLSLRDQFANTGVEVFADERSSRR